VSEKAYSGVKFVYPLLSIALPPLNLLTVHYFLPAVVCSWPARADIPAGEAGELEWTAGPEKFPNFRKYIFLLAEYHAAGA
jgi:hypothetical protein